MRTLVYKRTHTGDPDSEGRFGIRDCMGRVRTWAFDAVIGIGGVGPEACANDLANKVTWVGVGPHREWVPNRRGPIVTFDHFVLYDAHGPSFTELAPALARRVYAKHIRVLITGLSAQERREVDRVLALASGAPPSLKYRPEVPVLAIDHKDGPSRCPDPCRDAGPRRPKSRSGGRRHNVRCS